MSRGQRQAVTDRCEQCRAVAGRVESGRMVYDDPGERVLLRQVRRRVIWSVAFGDSAWTAAKIDIGALV